MTPKINFSVAYLILFVCSTFIHMNAFADRRNSYNSPPRDSRRDSRSHQGSSGGSRSHRCSGSSGSTRSQGQMHMRVTNDYRTGTLTNYSRPETSKNSSGQTITRQTYQSSRSGKPAAKGTLEEKFNSTTGTRIREKRDQFGQTQGYIRH